MAIELEAIVGADNMTAAAKEKVIGILKALNAPPTTKRFLYARWARLVGFEPLRDDIDRVAPWTQAG